jgi:hypothetical protein
MVFLCYGLSLIDANARSLDEGDITFFRVVGSPMILVSSADVALDLMERRSAIYSDKPSFEMDHM